MFWHLVDEPIEIPDKWATSPLVMSSIVKLLSFFCKLIIIFSWLSLVFFSLLLILVIHHILIYTWTIMTDSSKSSFNWMNECHTLLLGSNSGSSNNSWILSYSKVCIVWAWFICLPWQTLDPYVRIITGHKIMELS